jgi:hypothetical protein
MVEISFSYNKKGATSFPKNYSLNCEKLLILELKQNKLRHFPEEILLFQNL